MKPSVARMAELCGRNLYVAAFNICRNPEEAEDAVQDAFVEYLSRRPEFESEEHARAWLFRVTINKAKNMARSFLKRSHAPLEEYTASVAPPSEDGAALFGAVMALPEKQRIVIHLFYYEDYSVKEISEILRISPGNVKVRLSRGRELLRAALKEDWDNDQ